MAPKEYPLLKAVQAGRPGTKSRPAAGPTYTCSLNGGAAPSMPAGDTLYELFSAAAIKHADARCLGHRPIIKGEAQAYEYQTFGQVSARVARAATALKGLGLAAKDKVAVLSINCPDWMVAMQACNRNNFVCVPLYETLGEDAIEYILGHSEARVVFVNGKRLGRVAAALGAVPRGQVSAVVHFGGGESKADLEAAAASGAKVMSFADLEAAGGAKRAAAPEPPAPEDLSTIMYTSGTTGNPKGVLLTHRAIVAAIASCNTYLHSFNEEIKDGDCYFSFLPLAHVFDRLVEEFILANGGCVGYWQGEIPKVLADIGACRPTLFCGVPRVFDRIYAGINDQLAASWLKRAMFWLFMARKRAFMMAGFKHDKASPLADMLVFSSIKQKLGGRVRLILSGAAPLAPPVQEFLAISMCAPVLQGYGLTETCAASCIAEPFVWEANGTVGGPLPGVQVRLEAVPEMGYDPTADPPRGEVCIRGPTLFSGYYKEDQLTAECMDADGYFHTGDIAELVGRGTLRIIDRKKNIFKLSQGEYVAVEKLEGVYKGAPMVEQVWVYGNSFESTLVAVVVPDEKKAAAWAAAEGLPTDLKSLAREPRFNTHMLALLQARGQAEKLKGFELVKAVHVAGEQFTVDNGLMTPTFKLKRAPLQAAFQPQVDAMYARLRGSERITALDAPAGGAKKAGRAGGAATRIVTAHA
ncbi:MAG: hypothetical protein J3K34DRAFT_17054 [Monoraphidium minutum]|nr:MAG: hypothetical protein J3K34DRAFT_17054 [Monoraphidium minutum]